MSLKLALRILAVFFWWYGVVFVLSVAQLGGLSLPALPFLEYRGSAYAWDFELMFTAILIVWGSYLWIASKEPQQHRLFVDFTIVATIAHIAAMLVIGFIRTADLTHLLMDAVALSMPTTLVLIYRLRLVSTSFLK